MPTPAEGFVTVSFEIKYDESCSFVNPALTEAYAYWKGQCRGNTSMPTRGDVHPKGMRPFIKHVSIVDVRTDERGGFSYFVRLAGSEVERVLGRRSGKMLLDGVPEDQVPRWQTPFDRVRESGRPLRGFGRLMFQGKIWLNNENLWAPLGDNGKVTGMFCAFAATTANDV